MGPFQVASLPFLHQGYDALAFLENIWLGGVPHKMSIFQMVQKSFLSDQTYSNRSEYDFLQVWFNKIDHNMSIKGVKVDIFFPGTFCRWFLLGE